ncbi:MAG: tRNA (guanine-N(1)-)-methyltransferase [Parcubacteria group bacterium GW2011_GWA2_47_9]|nr:MAG: tRNA (guanine-N(1)-)-methyltransferase [Parcubacteria group bacterium GW2011_GWA2_47_9]
MRFDIVTIFPDISGSYLKESIIKRAQEKRLIKINVHNLRNWTSDRHKTVDDRPFGGGIGMVMKVEPIFKAVADIKKSGGKNKKARVVLFTPRGKKFNQKMAYRFVKLDQLIMICGRYEGIPGVIGKKQLLKERITKGGGFIEYPEYTRPPKFYPKGKFRRARPEVWSVPKVLLSGDHKKIGEWKNRYGKNIEK